MNMKKYFEYDSSVIPPEKIFSVTEEFLDDLYVNSSEVERLNIYFHLQREYFYLRNEGKLKEASYVCYLISYYLFVPLTPPHSDILALEFAKKAFSIFPDEKYKLWIERLKEGS